MNPLFVAPLFVYAVIATALPAQIDMRRRSGALLLAEAVVLAATLIAGMYLARLVQPTPSGLWWGKVGLYVTVYLYICGRGATLVRAALEIAPLQFRRIEDRTAGAVGLARGRAIGILERALVLTLMLRGEYAAIGFLMGAKALMRFKTLEDPETAEYMLIGTFASLCLAVLGAVGLQVLLQG